MMHRKQLLLSSVVALAISASICFSADNKSLSSVILDRPAGYLFESGITYIPESVFAGHGKSASFELDGDFPFGLIEDVGSCDIDIGLVFQDVMFLDNAGLNLPDQVGKLAMDLGFTFQSKGANAYQFRLRPGLYSDFESLDTDGLFVPMSGAVIHSFTPDFAGIIGVQVRPGFDTLLMPMAGVVWDVAERFRIEAGLPRSRIEWTVVPDLKTYIALDWRNTSYFMDESAGHGDQITLEDFRAYWGVLVRVASTLQVSGEIGTALNRSIELDANPRATIDIEDSVYARVAIGAPF